MKKYDKETLEQLIEGELDWPKLKEIITSEKDPDRFEKIVSILQEKVPWKEKIVLPLTPVLFIVKGEGGEYITKCHCGYDYGDYRENYKTKCRIMVRDTDELLEELYPPYMHSDPEYMELREFYCPGCYTLLEVEAVPPGYPVIFDFLPDLEAFYREILKRPLP